MCHTDYEPAELWDETWIKKARKPHGCGECCREIERGERYMRIFAKWDGRVEHWAACEQCAAATAELVKNCDGYMVHGVMDDFYEHGDEYGRAAFYRVNALGKRKWMYKGRRVTPEELQPVLERCWVHYEGG